MLRKEILKSILIKRSLCTVPPRISITPSAASKTHRIASNPMYPNTRASTNWWRLKITKSQFKVPPFPSPRLWSKPTTKRRRTRVPSPIVSTRRQWWEHLTRILIRAMRLVKILYRLEARIRRNRSRNDKTPLTPITPRDNIHINSFSQLSSIRVWMTLFCQISLSMGMATVGANLHLLRPSRWPS